VKSDAAIIKSVDNPAATIVATGSEVHIALEAAQSLANDSISVNVVSMPSVDRFAAAELSEQLRIVPTHIPSISVEAGSTFGWSAITGHHIGIDRFGASAPGGIVMDKLGMSSVNIHNRVKDIVSK
jgi:transketolase